VSEAAAQHAAESFADFLIRCFWFLVKNSFGSEDYTAQTEAALGGAFVDKGLLDRMRFIRCAEALKSRDFVSANRVHGHDTGTHDMAAQDYGAGSALGHAASEFRSTQSKLVTQDKQEWC
jgi:hypothetical protein